MTEILITKGVFSRLIIDWGVIDKSFDRYHQPYKYKGFNHLTVKYVRAPVCKKIFNIVVTSVNLSRDRFFDPILIGKLF